MTTFEWSQKRLSYRGLTVHRLKSLTVIWMVLYSRFVEDQKFYWPHEDLNCTPLAKALIGKVDSEYPNLLMLNRKCIRYYKFAVITLIVILSKSIVVTMVSSLSPQKNRKKKLIKKNQAPLFVMSNKFDLNYQKFLYSQQKRRLLQ